MSQQAALISESMLSYLSRIETENYLLSTYLCGLFSMRLTHYTVFIFNLKSQTYSPIHAKYSEHLSNIVLHESFSDTQTSISIHKFITTEEIMERGFYGKNISCRGVLYKMVKVF